MEQPYNGVASVVIYLWRYIRRASSLPFNLWMMLSISTYKCSKYTLNMARPHLRATRVYATEVQRDTYKLAALDS